MQFPARGNGSPRLTALLLIGHGSARHPGAGVVLEAHAAALRNHVGHVAVGLLTGSPFIGEALAALDKPVVHAVPFFMDDGYFTRVAMARALERADAVVHRPIGVHPGISALIAARAPTGRALVLVAHGSARAPGRRLAAHDHAATLRASGRFPSVDVACLEEPPSLPDVLARIGDRPVAVMGLFAGPGAHARDDLPALLNSPGRRHKPLPLGIIGEDPGLRALILDMIAEKTP